MLEFEFRKSQMETSGKTFVAFLIFCITPIFCQAPCRDHRGQTGRCDLIANCPELLRVLQRLRQNLNRPNDLSIIRSSHCGTQGHISFLCCPSSPTVTAAQPINPLPEHCGELGLERFIVGGKKAEPGEWPWIAAMISTERGRLSPFCGGTLITDRYVLSAAHCFQPSVSKLAFVRLGELDFSKPVDCLSTLCAPPVQDIPPERIINHPSYKQPCENCNDISLVKLSRRADTSSAYVTPICLPLDPEKDIGNSVRDFNGMVARAAGWGSISRDPRRPSTPDILQQVDLPVRELAFCASLRRFFPDSRMALCAGGEGRDTCSGDSGGPLVLTDNFRKKHYLVGVTSLGPIVCGQKNTQALYTSVNYYIDWILQTVRS